MQEGRVLSVNIAANKGEKKRNIGEAYIISGYGLENDAHGGDWHRQVSLLSLSSFEKMRSLGANVGYGDFAENITVEGLDVYELPVGSRIRVGEALLQVTQIGKECHQGCAIRDQVGDCVMPREGIFAVVVEPGRVRVGDAIAVLELGTGGTAGGARVIDL